MYVVLFYFEGECEVIGTFDGENKAYEYIGRYQNGDAFHPRSDKHYKSASLFVRPVLEVNLKDVEQWSSEARK